MEPIPLHHVWTYTDVDRAYWSEHLEDWVPRRIFDAHVHISDRKFCLEPMTDEKRRQFWVNELEESISAADLQRCMDVVFPGRKLSILAMGYPSLRHDVEAVNDDLQAECVRRGWRNLAMIRPQWPVEKVAALLDRPGVVGVKVYYDLISYDPNSRDKHLEASIFEFLPHHQLELLNDRRCWVTLHVPKAGRLGHPDNVAEVKEIRRRYPNVVLVVAHFGRSYTMPHARESLPQLADDPGLYFDNAGVMNGDVHRFAMETLGPERVVFGTDHPLFFMRGRRRWDGRTYINHTSHPFHFNVNREPPDVEAGYTLYLYQQLTSIKQACQDLALTRQQIEGIFRDNAARLLSLDAT